VALQAGRRALFASSNDLVHQFDHVGDPTNVVIDMSESHRH
jgi:SulP family sulfate permease